LFRSITISRAPPDPSESEIREFLGGHLCRCTGYVPIVAAALNAAKKLREAKPHA
jgi:2-furoyl-CoA dehydrogenase 2Fe-2S iron sulfur subunit